MEKSRINQIKEEAKKAEELVKPITTKYKVYNAKTRQMETRERIIRSGKEGNSYKRIGFAVTLFLAELGFLAFIYLQFIVGFLWFLIIPYSLGIIFACRVAVGNKNYDSKIAWILFLLILAPVSVIAYLLAGEMTNTPIKSRRLKRINHQTKFLPKAEIPNDLPPRIKHECTYIQNTSDYVPCFNGTADYFPTGEDFFEDVLIQLRKAEKFIFMDFFILKEGRLANAIFEILAEKAKNGVDVRILTDGLGSHGTLSLFKINRIRKQGIKLKAFEPVIPVANLFFAYRDHRKIIIIDGHTGYTGGTNLADEYINAKTKYGVWKDASIKISGNAVRNLTLMFLRIWEYSSKQKTEYESFLNCPDNDRMTNKSVLLPYGDGPSETHKLGKAVYGNMIGNAQHYLYLMTPYFIMDNYLTELLKAKAQSGVDVRLIIPGIPDKKLVYSLTFANAEKLISSGVRVYTYTPGFLHSKVMMSDDECAVVGSINMDFRSFYQQYESAVYIAQSDSIKQIAKDFSKTFAVSKEITKMKKRNSFNRMWLSFIRLFAPLM